MQRAVEVEQVQRALEEQRKLEEEAKTVKKKEAEERQRKAREERQRKEVEKKQQVLLEKEEAVRKKAEEAATKKREAEEKRKQSELAAIQAEKLRVKREEEEHIRALAAEKALTEAIQEAAARRVQQEKEDKEREREKDKEREREREKEKEKAAKELKSKPVTGGGGPAIPGKGGRGRGGESDMCVAAVDASAKKGGGVGGKKATDSSKRVEKMDLNERIDLVGDRVAGIPYIHTHTPTHTSIYTLPHIQACTHSHTYNICTCIHTHRKHTHIYCTHMCTCKHIYWEAGEHRCYLRVCECVQEMLHVFDTCVYVLFDKYVYVLDWQQDSTSRWWRRLLSYWPHMVRKCRRSRWARWWSSSALPFSNVCSRYGKSHGRYVCCEIALKWISDSTYYFKHLCTPVVCHSRMCAPLYATTLVDLAEFRGMSHA